MNSETLPPPLPPQKEQLLPPLPNYTIIDNRRVFYINKENISMFRNTMLGNQILFDDLEKEERCIVFYTNSKDFYNIRFKDYNNKACFDKVTKGELIFRITLTYFSDFVEEFFVQTLSDGIIVWNPQIDVSNGSMIYTIYKDENEVFDSIFKAELQVHTDEFSKQITIGTIQDFPICNFDIKINIKLKDNKHQLIVCFDSKQVHSKKINTMNFLFQDDEILSLTNFTEPYKDGNFITQKILSTSEVKLLANKKIKRVNIVNKQGVVIYENRAFKNVFYYSGHGVKQEFVDEMKEKAFRVYLHEYLMKYHELGLNELEDIDTNDDDKQETQRCSVYLMHDTANDTFKIGISNKPKFRERTLLSEKPTIELICHKEFPNRKIAESFEKALHNAYSDKRIRGEWFKLDENDIKELKETLTE